MIMPKYGTNEEVIHAFAHGEEEPETTRNESLTQRGWMLFSYREPIAVRPKCPKESNDPILTSGDIWSHTTSRHQRMCREALYSDPHFTTSFSMISMFMEWALARSKGFGGINNKMVAEAYHTGELRVVDWEEDLVLFPTYNRSGTPAYWVDRQNAKVHNKLPAGTTVTRFHYDGSPARAHRAASAVFSYQGFHALAGMDENQYFISVLLQPVSSLTEAFEMLAPDAAKDGARLGLELHRQGEWFFIEHLVGAEAKEVYNQWNAETHNLIGNNGGNPHVATRGEKLEEGYHLVSGQVRHEEHSTARLSTSKNPKIFIAVENMAVVSFTAGAQGIRVD
jgi:hypothetical protein